MRANLLTNGEKVISGRNVYLPYYRNITRHFNNANKIDE